VSASSPSFKFSYVKILLKLKPDFLLSFLSSTVSFLSSFLSSFYLSFLSSFFDGGSYTEGRLTISSPVY